jgi:hypothetical protein
LLGRGCRVFYLGRARQGTYYSMYTLKAYSTTV